MSDAPNRAELPASISAERTILGAVLLDGGAYGEISETLKAEDFILDSNQRIFRAMGSLFLKGRPIDIVTLSDDLTRSKDIDPVGGVAYLALLTEGLPRRPVVTDYVRIVRDRSTLRQLMTVCNSGLARAQDQGEDALGLVAIVLQQLSDVEYRGMEGADLQSVGQWLDENDVFEKREAGLDTGIEEYDELTMGLHPQELTIFAGRAGMGKTAHCGTIAWQMARRGKDVGVFINEQSRSSFIGRMLCGRSGVSLKNYRAGTLDMIERLYIEEARDEFRSLPIFIDQRSKMSISSIRAKSARLKRNGQLDVILVDQLYGISNEGLWEKGIRGDELLGRKVQGLKDIAVDLKIPVGLYHQLSRQTTKNEDSRPSLTDLKNSGEIEERADNVALLHRPGYYKREDGRENEAEIILAKQRDGATGVAHCEFIGRCCLWQNRRKR